MWGPTHDQKPDYHDVGHPILFGGEIQMRELMELLMFEVWDDNDFQRLFA